MHTKVFGLQCLTTMTIKPKKTGAPLRYAVHRIGLYASEDIFSQISKLSTLLLKGSRDISDYIVEISTLMRKDLKSTKRGKLY